MRVFFYYLVVGTINTLVWLITMVICAYFYDNYVFYTTVGYIVSLLVSFSLNLKYTFKVSGVIVRRISLFFFINLANLVVVQYLQTLLIDYYALPKELAILIGVIWYTLTGFYLNQRYVFHPSPQKHEHQIIDK